MMSRQFTHGAALAAFTLLPTSLFAAEIGATGGKTGELKMAVRAAEPVRQPASDDAQKQQAKFVLPPGFAAELWAAEPMLANPVAFDIDEKGRVFVAETFRYRTSVLDIRHYMFMLEEDLACRTTDDRIAMTKRSFPKDWQQLEIETEEVRLVEDRDGDGKADFSSTYASGMNTMLDGINSGVLAIDGQVWCTNMPNLWRFSGTTAEGKAAKRESLSSGYGVRFSFTGHDMHGLAMGPDGRLYFSFGDRGASVHTREGRQLDFPDEGAVFRCEPDGSQMEVFHRGLRNPQELAFDDHGNLFTGDNDCDQGDRERWVYLVEGGDSGWRVGWQHPPLGKQNNMWLSERLWEPRGAGTPAWVLSPIMNIPDGPSGVVHNPGTGLPPEFADAFLVCGFKGSSAKSAIAWWKVKEKGAGFTVDQEPATFLGNVQATDVTFGPDSKLYFTEWGEGWEGQGRGRIFKLANAEVEKAQAAQIADVKKLLGEGFLQRPVAELAQLFAHADQRVRLRAQWALSEQVYRSFVDSKGRLVIPDELSRVIRDGARGPAKRLSRLHGIWALANVMRRMSYLVNPTDIRFSTDVFTLLYDADPEVRAQILAAAAQLPGKWDNDALYLVEKKLTDDAPRVRFFAAQALAKAGARNSFPAVVEMLRANADHDEYLRHAGVRALAACGTPETLRAAAKDESKSVRLAVLLALRSKGDAAVAQFLDDAEPDLVKEAARAIVEGGIEAAMPELAKLIARPRTQRVAAAGAAAVIAAKGQRAVQRRALWADENLMLRVLDAAFRSGDAPGLAALATDEAEPDLLRVEALTLLSQWPQPPARDRVTGLYRPLPARDAQPAIAALAKVMAELLADKATAVPAMQAVVALGMKDAGELILAFVGKKDVPAKARGEALRTLAALEHPKLADAVKLALTDDDSSVRVAASAMLGKLDPEQAAQQLGAAFGSADLADKKQILVALGDLKSGGADRALAGLLEEAKAGRIPAEAQLELIEAAAKHDAIKPQLTAWLDSLSAADKLGRYSFALAGGDAEAGEKIFKEHAIAQCFRCHKVKGSGGEAGPDLTTVGAQKDRRYLLEAIVDPNAKIAHGFDSVICTLTTGDIKAGILKAETPVDLTLQPAGAAQETVKKADIKSRDVAPSGMPPGLGEMLTRRELRDVVEYVAGLK